MLESTGSISRLSLDCQPSSVMPSTSNCTSLFETLEMLPDDLLLRIVFRLPPTDRLQVQLVSRRFARLLAKWTDVTGVEIRTIYEKKPPSSHPTRRAFTLTSKPQPQVQVQVSLTDELGRCARMVTRHKHRNPNKLLKRMLLRFTHLKQLTVHDSALTPDLASCVSRLVTVQTLRLWNCNYFLSEKKTKLRPLIYAFLRLPNLDSLLVLDSTLDAANASSCRAHFDKSFAAQIRGPIRSFQLSGVHLSLGALDALADRISGTCTRLAIGCVFCKESRRLDYINRLHRFRHVNDLDLPPSIFHLRELEVPDGCVERLLQTLPLKALGFRHYNSSVLFRFIETRLPMKIRVLRVYHSANRIPNFAALGQSEDVTEKKSSVVSILSASRSSIGSGSAIAPTLDVTRISDLLSSCSENSTVDPVVASSLAARRLTIFALAESRRQGQSAKLKQREYVGGALSVLYLRDIDGIQEVFGRMAEPIKSPHVYHKNMKANNQRLRIVHGDFVKLIPLDRLGFESESENEQFWEEN